jgi:hypothetical protein
MTVLVPGAVLAHSLGPTYASRLPLAVYLAGAAATVALSFIFVLARDVRADRPSPLTSGHLPPRPIRYGLRAIGLIAWAWIIVQGILGGSSDAEVASLFLWVYGWVGIAMASALVGPVWQFIDPFSTIHDVGAAIIRRAGIQAWDVATYPERLGRWPAALGFLVVVWLELVLGAGPQVLFIVLVGYTALTVAMMAQFGRDTWRSQAEVFTVWFRLLGRLAPFALVDEDGRVTRRSFATGLLQPGFTMADVVIVALGVGSILFDGLSQTQIWFDTFGLPGLGVQTLLMLGFLAIVIAAAVLVTRAVGIAATAAGLLPIAFGYLVAHYLTYLLIDGQRIVIAVSDPFQRGWDLFGTAFHEVSADWLPAGLVWTIQLAAVVGGHMLGAWAGHVVAALEAPEGRTTRSMRRRQIPLAVVMVVLTTVTLWSLGQAIVVTPEARSTVPVAVESAAGSPIGHQGDDGSSSSPSSSASSTASRMLSEPSSR